MNIREEVLSNYIYYYNTPHKKKMLLNMLKTYNLKSILIIERLGNIDIKLVSNTIDNVIDNRINNLI
jgi:hypothetical protein